MSRPRGGGSRRALASGRRSRGPCPEIQPRGELHRAGSSVPARREARVDLALEFLGEAGLHEVRDGADGERRVLEIRLEVVPGEDDNRDGGRVGAALKFADSAPAVECRHLQVHYDVDRGMGAALEDSLRYAFSGVTVLAVIVQ